MARRSTDDVAVAAEGAKSMHSYPELVNVGGTIESMRDALPVHPLFGETAKIAVVPLV